jgi:DNA repair protein RadC
MSDETYQPLRLKDLAVGERPQERLEKLGPTALSDTELLAMLLRSGSKGHNVLLISQQLMTQAGSLEALIRWTERDFSRLKGIGRIKALQLVTVMEIARRVLIQGGSTEPVLNRPDLVMQHFHAQIAALSVEKFWVLCLNRKNRLLKRWKCPPAQRPAASRIHGRFSGKRSARVPPPSSAFTITRAVLCRIPFYAAPSPAFGGS